jgi:hypothetical protein
VKFANPLRGAVAQLVLGGGQVLGATIPSTSVPDGYSTLTLELTGFSSGASYDVVACRVDWTTPEGTIESDYFSFRTSGTAPQNRAFVAYANLQIKGVSFTLTTVDKLVSGAVTGISASAYVNNVPTTQLADVRQQSDFTPISASYGTEYGAAGTGEILEYVEVAFAAADRQIFLPLWSGFADVSVFLSHTAAAATTPLVFISPDVAGTPIKVGDIFVVPLAIGTTPFRSARVKLPPTPCSLRLAAAGTGAGNITLQASVTLSLV